MINFTCNVCGKEVPILGISFNREIPSCSFCSSTVRIREIAWHLSFFRGKNLKVVGLSDHEAIANFAKSLEFDYINSYFDVEPQLDISHPSEIWHNFADILISSDVMEHVMPPIGRAFLGHYRVLKPGGTLIMTTPYFHRSSFIEKYPHMWGYSVDESGQVFANGSDYKDLKIEDPIFHGGPGNTLEMRLFTPEIIEEGLDNVGFQDITFNETDIRDHGIIRSETQMGTITARKPLN
jgi:hypothetical protein